MDKILVFNPNLFDAYDKYVEEKVMLEGSFFWKYLEQFYEHKTFQYVMENVYNQDLMSLLAQLKKATTPIRESKQKSGFSKRNSMPVYVLKINGNYNQEEKRFIEALIRSNSRTKDIVDALLKEQLLHEYRLDYVDLLCHYTIDKKQAKTAY